MLLQKSHAGAVHLVYVSVDFCSIELRQNSGDIGDRPIDVKNSSAAWNILSGVNPSRNISPLMFGVSVAPGLIISIIFLQF